MAPGRYSATSATRSSNSVGPTFFSASRMPSDSNWKRSEERTVGKECRYRCNLSPDVCSSDLHAPRAVQRHERHEVLELGRADLLQRLAHALGLELEKIGRAYCRERV